MDPTSQAELNDSGVAQAAQAHKQKAAPSTQAGLYLDGYHIMNGAS